MRAVLLPALLLCLLASRQARALSSRAFRKGNLLRQTEQEIHENTKYLPVVLWHGMGDSCCSTRSMGAIKRRIESVLPGVFVYSIATGSGEALDVLSSYFGDLNAQVEAVCDELLELPQLDNGFVAVGFSQGGQFLRAVVQRCQHLGPKMHTLVTMGSQHQGVMSLPGCGTDDGATTSLYCRMIQSLIGRGAYTSVVQHHVVQAQYVKDPYRLDLYQSSSIFLADINAEGVGGRRRSTQYHDNLSSLRRLVLYQFEDDDMVVPKESSHFGFFNGSHLLAMNQTALYQEDWIGLRTLDEAGRLVVATLPGRHMQFSLAWFEQEVLRPYLAVPVEHAGGGNSGSGRGGSAGGGNDGGSKGLEGSSSSDGITTTATDLKPASMAQ